MNSADGDSFTHNFAIVEDPATKKNGSLKDAVEKRAAFTNVRYRSVLDVL